VSRVSAPFFFCAGCCRPVWGVEAPADSGFGLIEQAELFSHQIGKTGSSDFREFLANVALNVWDDEEEIEKKDEKEP
jgi:hypothetical protein